MDLERKILHYIFNELFCVERKQKPKKKKAKPKIRTRLRHQSTSEGSCASSVDSEDLDFFEASPELPRKVLRAEITLDWSDEVGSGVNIM